ncbi:MAG TPA: hypothetical protein VFM05_01980, partial [Candidatus Saccharimonadales bacterium]|nr:hypothetical protein [Candidatus Saccharimonadales bacterium]
MRTFAMIGMALLVSTIFLTLASEQPAPIRKTRWSPLVSSRNLQPGDETNGDHKGPTSSNPESLLRMLLEENPSTASKQNIKTVQTIQVPSYVGADNGQAVIWDETTDIVHRLVTSLPVFKAFGISLTRRTLLYSPLKNRVPSGELLLENLDSGETTKLTKDLILEAAFSPDESKVAYTFATGTSFGLAVIDLNSNERQELVPEKVLPDYFQWETTSDEIFFFFTTDNENAAGIVPHRLAIANKETQAVSQYLLPLTFPRPSASPMDLEQSLREISAGHFEIHYSFEVNSPDATKKVCSANLLGNDLIRLCQTGVEDINLAQGQLIKVTNRG